MKRPLVWTSLLLLILMSACAAPRGRGRVAREPGLDAESTLEAQKELDRLRSLLDSGESAEALELARETLARFGGFESRDSVLLLAARAADAQQDLRRSESWLIELIDDYPESEHRPEALEHLAELSRSRGRDSIEARALLGLGALEEGHASHARLSELLNTRLSVAELDALAQSTEDGAARGEIELAAARRAIGGDSPPTLVADRLIAFLRAHPEHEGASELRAELGRISRDLGVAMPPDVELILDNRIGILCPLTGDNASLGQAMFDGAILALEEHNRSTGSELNLVSIDTRGDGVRAVQAAKKLIEEDGVLAIVGALLSSTTIPVATLCQERGVVLISPTATQETISELGDHVFQTNLTSNMETRLVAETAVERLRRRRFAIIHPANEEGERAAEIFRSEVERRGGRVVATVALSRGVADYERELAGLREAGPEAIFAPVNPTEMRLIAPHLNYYGIEAQLLGPSSWNNSLLAREAADSIDRALFPSDIALIPEAERQRFEDLWKRRYRGQPSNAFALKSYFAVQRILDAIDEGMDTREALQKHFAEMFSVGGSGRTMGQEKLRMFVDGKIEPFPVEVFPVADNAAPADSLESGRD